MRAIAQQSRYRPRRSRDHDDLHVQTVLLENTQVPTDPRRALKTGVAAVVRDQLLGGGNAPGRPEQKRH
jgi:hypothetical protein